MTGDLDAERAVLGGLLADPKRFPDVAALLKGADFDHRPHGAIFEAMASLDGFDTELDTLTLASELRITGRLGDAGGLAYLADLSLAVPTAANVLEYAKIVADYALRRRLIEACENTMRIAKAGMGQTATLLGDLESKLLDLGSAGSAKSKLRSFETVIMDESLEVIDNARKAVGGVTGLPTGMIELDRKLTGLHGGRLVIVGARPGGYKSALGLQFASEGPLLGLCESLIFSIEMGGAEVGMRALAAQSDVPLSRLRGEGPMSDIQVARLNNAAARLSSAPIWFDDVQHLDIHQIRATAKRLKTRRPMLKIVVVDYLQIVSGPGRGESREQAVATISTGLKRLSRELDVCVVALAQLGRAAAGIPPEIHHLRESGQIENDADVILLPYYEEPEEGATVGGDIEMEMFVKKNRGGGPPSSVPVTLKREIGRFLNQPNEVQPNIPLPPRTRDFTEAPEEVA